MYAVDYKDSVLLPKTAFPMRADLARREPDMLARWQQISVYEKMRAARQGAPVFYLHDGPPFANGDAHLGHALNMTLKDIVLKSRFMAGYDVPFTPGWDCHGLPIEHKVQKELGPNATAVEIRAKSAALANKFIAIQREQFQRLGVFGDWHRPYITMEPGYEAATLRVLAQLVGKNLVYQALRPVHWSTGCNTALAEAEIEYEERKDLSVHVLFPLKDRPGAHLLIWTTTPWTLPANVAVAAGADLTYGEYDTPRGTVICHAELAKTIPGLDQLTPRTTMKGADLVGLTYRHPFLEREGRVFPAGFVTSDTGTGLVHIAPGHGMDDYILGREHDLPILSPVDDRGRFTPECGVPEWTGLYVLDANPLVRDRLRDLGLLWHDEHFTHDYPHCWRSKTPIIFRAVKQWFIKVDAFRADALRAIGEVRWVPAWGENRIRGAVASRPDWCISRQRTWGIPLPVFYGEGGQPLLSQQTIEKFADLVAQHGTDIWFTWPDDQLATALGLPPGLRKGTDTLDVWIDSGTSWAAVSQPAGHYPADLYLEGSDQHRGWFQSSLLTSVAVTGRAPYKTVLTNGFVVDLDGKKLSKSNTYQKPVDLNTFVNKHGADMVRLWVASQDFRNDVPFSAEIFERLGDSYRALRNVGRVLLGNLHGFDPLAHRVPWHQLTPLDAWILRRLDDLITTCLAAYDRYEFHLIYQAINRTCSTDLSAFYVDVTKDRMYCDAPDSPRRRSAQTAMHRIVDVLTRLVAPILPYTADEMWRELHLGECIHLEKFPEPLGDALPAPALDWDATLALRDQVNARLEQLRQQKIIAKSLEAQVTLDPAPLGTTDTQLLAEILNVARVISSPGAPLTVEPGAGRACQRCWKVLPEVGTHPDHPGLCDRCHEVVTHHYPNLVTTP